MIFIYTIYIYIYAPWNEKKKLGNLANQRPPLCTVQSSQSAPSIYSHVHPFYDTLKIGVL